MIDYAWHFADHLWPLVDDLAQHVSRISYGEHGVNSASLKQSPTMHYLV
jgi:hypothetical protein